MSVDKSADPRIPERVWIYCDALGGLMLARQKPITPHAAEFMRVLSRQEVDKLAGGEEGVDRQQYVNSLLRTIEGQKKHIAHLQNRIADLHEIIP